MRLAIKRRPQGADRSRATVYIAVIIGVIIISDNLFIRYAYSKNENEPTFHNILEIIFQFTKSSSVDPPNISCQNFYHEPKC